ncbi:cobD/Cbib family protein [Mycobacterium xenopi 3993]|nr:cobD/Cbib family protein [Mycobacterium xenopi 3993]
MRPCRDADIDPPGPAGRVALGYLADLLLSDPKRGHPVAGFGGVAALLERITYRDNRIAGAVHVGVLVGAVGVLGTTLQRAAERRARGGP